VKLPSQGQGLRASQSHKNLESFVPRQITKYASKVWIVFHNEQYGVIWLQVIAIVLDVLGGALGYDDLRQLQRPVT